ncbi:MAG: tetratricopeptide repeat protein [Magnetococcus sp. DMHC-6]
MINPFKTGIRKLFFRTLFLLTLWIPCPLHAGSEIDENLQAATNALKQNAYETAIALFNKVLEKSDLSKKQLEEAWIGQCTSHYRLGLSSNSRQELQSATEACTNAIQKGITSSWIYLTRGNAFLAIGDLHRAVEDLTTLVAQDPKNALAFQSRGLARAQQGRQDLALEDFTSAIRIQPDNPWTYFSRGKLYASDSLFDKAIDDYSAFIRFKSDYEPIYLERGKTRMLVGQYQQAIGDFYQSLDLKPENNAISYGFRGMSLFLMSRYSEAVTDFKKVLDTHPQDIEMHLWLYTAQRRAGESDQGMLKKVSAENASSGWPGVLLRYMQGKAKREEVLSAISQTQDRKKRQLLENQAVYFMGQEALIRGQQQEADELFKKLLRDDNRQFIYYAAGLQELKHLDTANMAPFPRKEASSDTPLLVPNQPSDPSAENIEKQEELLSTPFEAGEIMPSPVANNKEIPSIKIANQGQSGFVFKVASFQDRTNAHLTFKEIENLNLPVFIEETQIQGKTYQRVWVGPFPDEATADKARLKVIAAIPNRTPTRVIHHP